MNSDMTFGALLQSYIRQSGVKNSTVADALQYDISYISKWINGKMLPSEKNIERICTVTAEALSENYRTRMKLFAESYVFV